MFSSGKKPAAGSGRDRRKSGTVGLSLVGADVLVSGDLATTAQIHIDGRIDGNVRCDTLVQGEDGIIAGNIIADSVHLSGLVDGMVTARLVTLEPSARVTGDVTYETLSIAAGAAIDGRLTHREGGAETAAPIHAVAVDPPGPDRRRPRPAAVPDEPSLLQAIEPPTVAAAG